MSRPFGHFSLVRSVPPMPSHALLVAAILVLTLLGFGGIIMLTRRHRENEHEDDREPGDHPLTA